jgi:T5orf172 domain
MPKKFDKFDKFDKPNLDDIFNDDPFGLLNIKPAAAASRNEDERIVASFQDINDFYEKNNREPQRGMGNIMEHQLCTRLKALRENTDKIEMLKSHDRFGLLNIVEKKFKTFDDLINDNSGLLDDNTEGLFDFKHIKKPEERAATDFVAKRKPCKDFENYEALFKSVQQDLKQGKRKIVEFSQQNLREGTFYVHNGILFLLEKINITQKEHYREDGTRVRADGRTRCIFENGTQSNMLKRSVEKILYANGKVVSENEDTVNENFKNTLNNITADDKETGFIYVLKSKSDKKDIKSLQNLYKIGYSTTNVEERIKNAAHEPTYLMADVQIVMTYKCYNMNPHKFEQLIHTFFGEVCLNVDVMGDEGKRYMPREWFIVPLDIIETAVELLISGDIMGYRYDSRDEAILER